MDPPRLQIQLTNVLRQELQDPILITTYGSTQVTRKFQNRVTLVWGRPTVAWGWTNLGHQGSMSVFTRNKCYLVLDIFRITFPRYNQSEILTQPTFLES